MGNREYLFTTKLSISRWLNDGAHGILGFYDILRTRSVASLLYVGTLLSGIRNIYKKIIT